ncbi:protein DETOXIFICATION 9-like isoform X1 [Senna tora]|uniref:Protein DETOXIFICATION 9-like isoform X1 n=1 Tax=Senna tora TaxID=362788 RepID=A0A834WAY9_9FABA|nr:protein DETOXIFICATION 9-like isoform X1 [Senna tora]
MLKHSKSRPIPFPISCEAPPPLGRFHRLHSVVVALAQCRRRPMHSVAVVSASCLAPSPLNPNISRHSLLRLETQRMMFPMVLRSSVVLCLHIVLCWILVFRFGLGHVGAALTIGILYWINVIGLRLYVKNSSACEKTRIMSNGRSSRGSGRGQTTRGKGRSMTQEIDNPPDIVVPSPPTASSPPIAPSPPIVPSPHSSVHSNAQHDNEQPQIDEEQPHLSGRPWAKDPTDGKTWIYPNKKT